MSRTTEAYLFYGAKLSREQRNALYRDNALLTTGLCMHDVGDYDDRRDDPTTYLCAHVEEVWMYANTAVEIEPEVLRAKLNSESVSLLRALLAALGNQEEPRWYFGHTTG